MQTGIFLRVHIPHTAHKRAKRACKFECFFIFLFLEYRKLTTFVLLLGTRRQRKIKNHLKFSARREIILIRFDFMLLPCQSKIRQTVRTYPAIIFEEILIFFTTR